MLSVKADESSFQHVGCFKAKSAAHAFRVPSGVPSKSSCTSGPSRALRRVGQQAIASSLTDLDLVFIEEAFERLLLDYDRVFSTMGVPACLWRRTGELFKGNKEMAELVGVPIEMLRDGRLAIYELMAEESAVSYWEKYSSIAFDSGQKVRFGHPRRLGST